jgi:nitrate reductase delta subunit
MIDLGAQYARHGCLLETRELPDFIPVFLEYASCLPAVEARETLGQPAHVFAALAERLEERRSPYAAVFRAVLAAAQARPDAAALAELEDRAPDEDPARIDEDWEEAPVSFETGAACAMGGPTGFVAKFRAARRAASEPPQLKEKRP